MNGLSTNRRCTHSAPCLHQAGQDFVFRYYSETTSQPEKVLTPGEARALQDAGLRLAVVYQDRARRAEDFTLEHGRRDGQFAAQYARQIGQAPGSTIFFAVDYDAPAADMGRITTYFDGVREALAAGPAGGSGLGVGAYGSGFICRSLAEQGLVTHTWLAEATGWRESASYQGWNVKQFVTHQALCQLPVDGWERCVSQGTDQSWSFRLTDALPPDAVPNVNTLPVLRRGAAGIEVERLQRLLNHWLAREGALLLIEDGHLGARTDRAVRAFQSSNVDNLGRALAVDGVVGGITWGALLRIATGQPDPAAHPLVPSPEGHVWWESMPVGTPEGSPRGRAALGVAVGESIAGAGEVGGDNMGPDVDKYLNDIVEPPNDWCAGFVCWCLKESGAMPFPYTVGARKILSLAAQAGLTTFKDPTSTAPQPGDIVVWWRGSQSGWQGHTGFVHHVDQGRLFTIEGNRTSRVEGFDYPLVGMEKLLGLVRLE